MSLFCLSKTTPELFPLARRRSPKSLLITLEKNFSEHQNLMGDAQTQIWAGLIPGEAQVYSELLPISQNPKSHVRPSMANISTLLPP